MRGSRVHHFAILAALVLTWWIPSVNATPTAIHAEVTADTLASDGAIAGTGTLQALRSDVEQAAATPDQLRITFDAERLEVEEVYAEGYGAGQLVQGRPSPTTRQSSYTAAHGSITEVQGTSEILLFLEGDAAALTLNRPGGPLAVESVIGIQETFRTLDTATQPPPPQKFQDGDPALRLASSDGRLGIEVHGNLTLVLYGVSMDVEGDAARGKVESGEFKEPQPGGASYETRQQIATLHFSDATVHLDLSDRPAYLFTSELRFEHAGRLDATDASGGATLNDAAHTISHAAVSLEGAGSGQLRPAHTRIAATLDGEYDTAAFAPLPRRVEPKAALDTDPYVDASVWGLGVLTVVAAAVTYIVLQRRRLAQHPVFAASAQRGIIAGDFALALRDSERALRLKPNDATSHVTKGIALVRLGRDEEAFNFAAQRLSAGPEGPTVPFLAYVAAAAAARLGRTEESAKWLNQAQSASEGLEKEAHANPIFDLIRTAPIQEGPPPEGYA